MRSNALLLLPAVLLFRSASPAQISLSGETEVHMFRTASTTSPRAVNDGRPSFGWRTDFFMTAAVTEKIGAAVNVRVADNQYVNFDYLALRLVDLTPIGLNIEAGKFDAPFGNLGQRRFPRRNALFALPLMYEYRTALPNYYSTATALAAGRGMGVGMRLLDGGMYNLGVMVDGTAGILDYAFALTSGTVSATSAYGYANFNSDLGKIARVAVTPLTGLTIGAAYAWGGYLDETAPSLSGLGGSYVQKAFEADLEFSRGHLVFDAEGVYCEWPVPVGAYEGDPGFIDRTFRVFGFYAEAKYTIVPRLFGALRVSGLRFGRLDLGQGEAPWDDNTTEWEAGLGYFVDKDVLLKVVRRETRIFGGTRPKDNLTVMQLVVAY